MEHSRREIFGLFAGVAVFTGAALDPDDAEAKAQKKKKPSKVRSSHRRASRSRIDYTPDDPLAVVEKAGAATLAIDAGTGRVLHEHNADKKVYPASLIKILTAIVVFDQIRSGRIGLSDPVTITAQMTREVMAQKAGGLLQKKKGSVLDMLHAAAILSSNEAAKALAYYVGGTEQKFVQMMQQKALEIGMISTTVRNATGYFDPQQMTTARDIARLMVTLVEEYADLGVMFAKKSYESAMMEMNTHNRLFGLLPGLDFNKTGFIRAAGAQNAGSVEAGGKRLVVVTMNVKTPMKISDKEGEGKASRAAALANAALAKRGFEELGVDVGPVAIPYNPLSPEALNHRSAPSFNMSGVQDLIRQ